MRGHISPVFQSTDRSWHDLDFCLKAIFLFFRATIRPRKRLAFLLMLSRRLQLAMRRAFSSLLSLRRRICRTMPSKRSRTLWCREAEVSMNLQSNTTAQALPSREERKKKCRWAITPEAAVSSLLYASWLFLKAQELRRVPYLQHKAAKSLFHLCAIFRIEKMSEILPSTETSRDRTKSLLFPTRMMGMFSDCRALRSWIRSSEAFSKLDLSVTEYTMT